MKNIRVFYLKIFLFLVVKFSIYLNRRVFVMSISAELDTQYSLIEQSLERFASAQADQGFCCPLPLVVARCCRVW